ncbi:hypothetical protein SASPL_129538 [Salvia splendens]|uniref:Uncharacterized protein n=1 Tax=Salvia splendens TaxID=180675 RepID=A0A8X8XCX5_SALSN|nr:uncharacterized protein LOC121752754 [Salvia splendens]KAG6411456.1 hypothetical protein SASPL_129538 [Salvia splendens]
MASPSSLKTLNSINLFSIKPPSLPPSSIKLKTLLQTFFFSHIHRALSKAKSLLLQILNLMRKRNQKKLHFASFRLHYNWCSSSRSLRYDVVGVNCSGELSKYLQWLDERGDDESSCNEIDRLADLFIADCHEKFRLEKQESYRRFQEMMARSV